MNETTYEQDYYAWALQNATLLRQGRLSEIDVANIAEELEAMGRSERRELEHRLAVLLAHLLKWVYQPQQRGHSWRYTIEEQRLSLEQLLEDSPSLRAKLDAACNAAYRRAVLLAAKETGIHKSAFPAGSPFTLEQTLGDYWPE